MPAPAEPTVELQLAEASVARERSGVTDSVATLKRCPRGLGKGKVVGIGSSTIASLLGPMVEKGLVGHGVPFALWGKASTSLVRPDFFDWNSKVPGILKHHKPAAWVIELGGNDNQPIKLRKGGWVRTDDPRWATVFAERIDELLLSAVGPRRDRAVVWVGPYAYPGEGSRVLGRRIHDLLTERIAAFPGPVFYVDSYTTTLDAAGKPVTELTIGGKTVGVRNPDGIHLRAVAVKALMAEPTLRVLGECFGLDPR